METERQRLRQEAMEEGYNDGWSDCSKSIRHIVSQAIATGATMRQLEAALAGDHPMAGPIAETARRELSRSTETASVGSQTAMVHDWLRRDGKTIPPTIAPQRPRPTGDLGDQIVAILEQGGGR